MLARVQVAVDVSGSDTGGSEININQWFVKKSAEPISLRTIDYGFTKNYT